jgi:hypothetical protein
MHDVNKQDRPCFPPYGLMTFEDVSDMKTAKLFPNDWKGVPGSQAPLDTQWKQWLEATVHLINDVLWPTYDMSAGSWQGKSSNKMEQLTRTDLGLLANLQSVSRQMLDQQIAGNVPGRSTHRELFRIEDGGAEGFGTYFGEYDAEFPLLLLKKLPQLIMTGLDAKSLNTDLQVKQRLQRPRAYQTALVLGFTNLFNLTALSAHTPSMCSGHCLQGLLALGACMERFELDAEPLKNHSWSALEQYAVDIGDRRVMAGVHYPSDNLCSWLIALRLADYVYASPRIRARLWTAISERSFVFKTICGSISQGKGDVYRSAMDEIERAASCGSVQH